MTRMRPCGSRSRTAARPAPAPAPAVAITLCPQACPIAGKASYSQRIAIVGPSPFSMVARKAVLDAGDAALDLESLAGEELRQPGGGLDFVVAQLGIVVDPP